MDLGPIAARGAASSAKPSPVWWRFLVLWFLRGQEFQLSGRSDSLNSLIRKRLVSLEMVEKKGARLGIECWKERKHHACVIETNMWLDEKFKGGLSVRGDTSDELLVDRLLPKLVLAIIRTRGFDKSKPKKG